MKKLLIILPFVLSAPAQAGLIIEGKETTINTDGNKDSAISKKYFGEDSMRQDRLVKRKVESLFIMRPEESYFCYESEGEKKCHHSSPDQEADNNDQQKKEDQNTGKDPLAELDKFGDTFQIKKWKVTKLKKKRKFAGHRCQMFRRQYHIVSDLGGAKQDLKLNEVFCVEQKNLKNPYYSAYLKAKSVKLGKKFDRIIRQEKKAYGTILFSKAKYDHKMSFKQDKPQESKQDVGGMFAGLMDSAVKSLAAKMNISSKSTVIFRATKAKNTKEKTSWWVPPKGFKVEK